MFSGNTQPFEPVREGEGLTEIFVRSLASGVLAVDAQMRITAFNRDAERMTGLSSAHVLHQPLNVLPEPLQYAIRQSFASGCPLTDHRVTLRPAAQREIILRLDTALHRDGDERVRGALVIFHDFTAAGSLENHMRRVDRLANLGAIAAGLAHEIRNALVTTKTFVDLLLEKNAEYELADLVRSEMLRIDSIVRQMLRFASPADPRFDAMHVHAVLEQSLRLLQPQLAARRIDVVRTFQAETDLISGDAFQLEQAFINLLFNSLDAMQPGDRLSVATGHVSAPPVGHDPIPAQSRRRLRVTITDTGIGIPPEHFARLFEPFFTTKTDGTGLGLPITRRIISEHGGEISAESQPRQGTTFAILLPLLDPTSSGIL